MGTFNELIVKRMRDKRKGKALNTELKNAVTITDKDAQYDESAKRLLGQKSILAHIFGKNS